MCNLGPGRGCLFCTAMIFAIRWRTECFVVVHGLIESKSCSVFERNLHAHRNDAWNMSGGDRN
jgi:hypothetical protein